MLELDAARVRVLGYFLPVQHARIITHLNGLYTLFVTCTHIWPSPRPPERCACFVFQLQRGRLVQLQRKLLRLLQEVKMLHLRGNTYLKKVAAGHVACWLYPPWVICARLMPPFAV